MFVDKFASSAHLICIFRSDHNAGRIEITRTLMKTRWKCKVLVNRCHHTGADRVLKLDVRRIRCNVKQMNGRSRNRVKESGKKTNLKGSHFLVSHQPPHPREGQQATASLREKDRQKGETLLSLAFSVHPSLPLYTRLWKWAGTSGPTAFIAYSGGAGTTHSGY